MHEMYAFLPKFALFVRDLQNQLTNLKVRREYNSLSMHACSFINKEVFTLSNYPDLNGLAYREESDFYIKATNKGIKIAYLGGDIKIFHYN